MEQIYDAGLQARLEKFVTSAGSQAKAARALGMSDSVISQYRRSAYKNGRVDEVESKLVEFFRLQDEAEERAEKAQPYAPVGNEYRETSISSDIYKAIRYAHIQKGITVLHGAAGIGKTMAAMQYVMDNPNTTVYIECSPVFGSLGSFLKLLCRALHAPEGRSKLDMILNIRAQLASMDKVLIIDEAQHLMLRTLEEIRTLSDPHMDRGRTGTGIVLIGNTEVYDRMLGRQQSNFAQLFSRVRLSRAYGTRQVKMTDVELIFPALADKAKERSFLLGVCQSRWGIRGGVNIYNRAVDAEDISINGLTLMAHTMGIGLV